jgi:hypothetical protein
MTSLQFPQQADQFWLIAHAPRNNPVSAEFVRDREDGPLSLIVSNPGFEGSWSLGSHCLTMEWTLETGTESIQRRLKCQNELRDSCTLSGVKPSETLGRQSCPSSTATFLPHNLQLHCSINCIFALKQKARQHLAAISSFCLQGIVLDHPFRHTHTGLSNNYSCIYFTYNTSS